MLLLLIYDLPEAPPTAFHTAEKHSPPFPVRPLPTTLGWPNSAFLVVFDMLFPNSIISLLLYFEGVTVRGFGCNSVFTLGFGSSGTLLSVFCGCSA